LAENDEMMRGKVYTVTLLDDIDGADAFKFDADEATAPYATVTATTGEVWTFNRSTDGMRLSVVDTDLMLLGGDKFLHVPHDDTLDIEGSEDYTHAIVYRTYGSTSGVQQIFGKKNGIGASNPGYSTRMTTTADQVRSNLSDGVTMETQTVNDATTDGEIVFFFQKREGDTTTAGTNSESSSSTGTQTLDLSNTEDLRIGMFPNGNDPGSFEFMKLIMFDRALSADELTELESELVPS
jgi:hypothetical protein